MVMKLIWDAFIIILQELLLFSMVFYFVLVSINIWFIFRCCLKKLFGSEKREKKQNEI